jgi:hypothetical protein
MGWGCNPRYRGRGGGDGYRGAKGFDLLNSYLRRRGREIRSVVLCAKQFVDGVGIALQNSISQCQGLPIM